MGEKINEIDGDSDIVVKEKPPNTKRPRQYKVIMLNDDYTPMEFVVHVLEYFFKRPKLCWKSIPQAKELVVYSLMKWQKQKALKWLATRERTATL